MSENISIDVDSSKDNDNSKSFIRFYDRDNILDIYNTNSDIIIIKSLDYKGVLTTVRVDKKSIRTFINLIT